MLILLIILCPALILSLFFNFILLAKLKIKPKRGQSVELQEFLVDLMAGPAMLAIARVDPNSVLLRSPKSR